MDLQMLPKMTQKIRHITLKLIFSDSKVFRGLQKNTTVKNTNIASHERNLIKIVGL